MVKSNGKIVIAIVKNCKYIKVKFSQNVLYHMKNDFW